MMNLIAVFKAASKAATKVVSKVVPKVVTKAATEVKNPLNISHPRQVKESSSNLDFTRMLLWDW